MFNIGDKIICGKNGVCVVEKIGPMELEEGVKSERLYYTLSVVNSSSSKVFTPVDNDKIVMRYVMTPDETTALLEEMDTIEEIVVTDEKRRENLYKEILLTCDCRKLIGLIKMLNSRKKKCIANGKKVHAVDERYLKIVQDALLNEVAYSLGVDKISVMQMFNAKLN